MDQYWVQYNKSKRDPIYFRRDVDTGMIHPVSHEEYERRGKHVRYRADKTRAKFYSAKSNPVPRDVFFSGSKDTTDVFDGLMRLLREKVARGEVGSFPYPTLLVAPTSVFIPVSTSDQKKCMEKADSTTLSEWMGQPTTYSASLGNDAKYALEIRVIDDKVDTACFSLMVEVLKGLIPKRQQHWTASCPKPGKSTDTEMRMYNLWSKKDSYQKLSDVDATVRARLGDKIVALFDELIMRHVAFNLPSAKDLTLDQFIYDSQSDKILLGDVSIAQLMTGCKAEVGGSEIRLLSSNAKTKMVSQMWSSLSNMSVFLRTNFSTTYSSMNLP